MSTADLLWIAVAACLTLAIAAGLADRRRSRRSDPDRVGLVNWPTVQVFALIAAAVLGSIAYNLPR